MRYETIRLDEINFNDERFRISFVPALDRLILSIREVGLLLPPLVRSGEDGYVIVAGWKRLLACQTLGYSPVAVLVSDEKNDRSLFLMALYENHAGRDFSLVEKAEILRRLLAFGENKENLRKKYLSLLSLPSTLGHLDVCLSLASADLDTKELIQAKSLPIMAAEMLLTFKPEERRLLLPLLWPLGQNKLKEVLEDLQEIRGRDSLSLEEIIGQEEAVRILEATKLSPLQKSEKIRLWLKKKRYPNLFSWKKAFASTLKKMGWPKSIALETSPYFEAEALTVTFDFKSMKEFSSRVAKLQEMAAKEEFSALFRV